MHLRTHSLDTDLRSAVDAGMELSNVLSHPYGDALTVIRELLTTHGFMRATGASEAEIDDVRRRFAPVAAIIAAFPGSSVQTAVEQVNVELGAVLVAPALVVHDGAPLHIHWASPTAPFGVQVVVDVLMGIANTLCEHGTARFGRCAAERCDRVFFDTTKNRSRRFCSDERCASRTHTAEHRARRRSQ